MNPGNGNDGRNNRDPGNNTDGQPKPKRMSEQAAIFNTFALIIRNKFSSGGEPEAATNEVPNGDMDTDRKNPKQLEHRLKKLDEAYKSPLYQAEKAMLQELNNNGFGKGLMCGVGTFLFLRSGPRLLRRYIAKNSKPITAHPVRNSGNSNVNVGGYSFDKTSGRMGMEMPGNSAEMIPQSGLFFRTIKFGLDVVGSVYMALFASAYFTNKKKLLNDMSQIPLVEGKSLLSDELCDDFIDVYRGIPKRTWEKYEGLELNGEGDGVEALTAIGIFVKNCLKRQAKENEILEEHRAFGIMEAESDTTDGAVVRKDNHPAIPSPGVSPDTPFAIEWGDNSDDVTVGKERHRDDFDLDDFGEVGFDDLFGDESSSFSAHENPDTDEKGK